MAEPFNLFAYDKRGNYPGYQQQQNQQQPIIPGQVQGYGANPVTHTQAQPQTAGGIKDVPKSQGTAGSGVQDTKNTTNNANSPTWGMDEVARAMGYTSPEQEEKLRKASVANQRIFALADAVRHIGNIAGAINYAPAQQLNSPVEEERKRYLQGKALRDKANQTYISYMQQKAAQDAKQKQWEMQFAYNAAKDAATAQALQEYRNASLKENARQADQTHGLRVQQAQDQKERYERQAKETNRHNTRMEGIAGMNAKTNRDRATAYINHLNSGNQGREAGGSTRAGYTYATKNGSITIPSDYLKSNINKQTIITAMERSNAVDKEWLDMYDSMQWNKEGQEKLLDKAISNWLMSSDDAEDFMERHLRGKRGGSATSAGTMPGVWGSGNGNTMPGVRH